MTTNSTYKRLTTYNKEFEHASMTATRGEDTCKTIARHVERLYELENAIENGTLVFLPCKVGDKVWYLNEYSYPPRIEEYIVDSVEFLKGRWVRCRVHSEVEPMETSFSINAIGVYIFTTKEAAEKALEELEK